MNTRQRLTPRLTALAFSLALPFSACAQDIVPTPPPVVVEKPAPDLKKAVADLASDDFSTRESAQLILWEAGRDGEPFLAETIAAVTDAESRMRIRRVLAEFSYGLYPDTPADISALVRQFRSGDMDERQDAISMLTEKSAFPLIFKLMGTVKDRDQREMLSRVVARHTENIIREHIVNGDLDKAAEILKISAVVPASMRNFAAFCHIRGTTASAVQELEASQNLPEAVKTETLHWFARAEGDFAKALTLAEQLDDKSLIRETRVLMGDIAAYCEGAVDFNTRTIRVLGYKAAMARHKGDAALFDSCIQDILKYAGEFPDEADKVHDALVANGRAEEALTVAREHEPSVAFDHLIRQERYEDAFALLDVDLKNPSYEQWVDTTCAKVAPTDESLSAYKVMYEIYTVARTLVIRGEKEAASAMMARAEKNFERYADELSNRICPLYRALDMRDLLFKHVDERLKAGRDLEDIIADVFYTGHFDSAVQWSTRFPEDLEKDKGAIIRRIYAILVPEQGEDSTETDKLLAETEEWLKANPQNFEEPDQLQQNANKRLFNGARAPIRNARFAAPPRDWHRTLAETYAVREQYAEARRHYALCQDTDLNGSTHLWIADYCVAENLWAEAAEAYRQAWEEDNSSEMNLFLQGWALHHAGGDSKAKGDELMLTARLLMLGSSSGGYDLVRMLWEQGDTDLAEPVSRLLMNLASPDDAESILTGARLYMHLRYTDKESEAAALCERFMLFCMTKSLTSDYARLFAGFLPSRSWIDTLLARADLRKGDTAAAMEKINTALKLTPGDSSAVEDFHPMLRERNLTAEANTVFDQVFPVSLNTIKTFPNYEQGHNNHAWLLARCQRNLDEALTHAQAALKIDPKSAASTDTLAEVYFAKGDFQKAVEASDKALKLTPTDAQLKTQNQRFRAALEKSKQ